MYEITQKGLNFQVKWIRLRLNIYAIRKYNFIIETHIYVLDLLDQSFSTVSVQ